MPRSRSTRASRSRRTAGSGPEAADVDRARQQPRARVLDEQRGGDRLRVHGLLGREALLVAGAGLGAQDELVRRRVDRRAVPVGDLEEHARRRLGDLGAVAAHDPGDRGGALVVGDEAVGGAERADLVVERDDLLTLLGAAHDESPTGDAVEVERVQRLPGQQHHVVRDVDDVVDRPLPRRRQARLEPQRRRADRDVLEHARGEPRAEVRRLHLDRHGQIAVGRARVGRPGRLGERRAGGGVDLARDAVETELVRPVGRGLEVEHLGPERQDLLQRLPRPQPVGLQDHDPGVVGADLELVLGEDHPLGDLAAQLGLLELDPARHDRAGPRDGDRLAGGDVRRAAHDVGGLVLADVDGADLQTVGVGMLLGGEHAADDEAVVRAHAARRDPRDLGPGHLQALGQLGGGDVGRAVLAQPFDGDVHQPNCSRTRRSLSYSSRRSGMPCLSMAIRSIPMPKAKPDRCSAS